MLRACLLRSFLMLGGLAGAIALAEVALRITGLAEVPGDMRSPYPRFYHIREAARGFDISPGFARAEFRLQDFAAQNGEFFQVWSNDMGCFDDPIEPGEARVLLVGDSFTWGYVPLESTWGSVVEREVGSRVAKCGVGAYGTRQARSKAEQLVRTVGPPALVILGYFVGNDLIDDYLFPQITVDGGYLATRVKLEDERTGFRRSFTDAEVEAAGKEALREPTGLLHVKSQIARHSVVYSVLRESPPLRAVMQRLGLAEFRSASRVPLVFRSEDRFPWLKHAWDEHLQNLRDLSQMVRTSGAKLAVVVIPSREQVYEFLRPPERGVDWEQPNRRLRRFFRDEGIDSIDLLEELRLRASQGQRRSLDPARDLYWSRDPHLNLVGNRLAGLLVSRYLLEARLIDPPDRELRIERLVRDLAAMSADAVR